MMVLPISSRLQPACSPTGITLQNWPMSGALDMLYAEAAYFDGAHVQHIADYQAEQTRRRRQRQAQEAVGRYRNRFPAFAGLWK